MTNACPAEKPHQGQKNRNRRSRRRKSAASHYRTKEKLRSGPRLASGPHVDYNARLYDPTLGRFLSVDPLIAHPGSTQSINPYSYVENNPLNKTDPTGEASAGCTGLLACGLINGAQGTKEGPREAQGAIGKAVSSGTISKAAGAALSKIFAGGARTANGLGSAISLAKTLAAGNRAMAQTAHNSNFDINTHQQKSGAAGGGGNSIPPRSSKTISQHKNLFDFKLKWGLFGGIHLGVKGIVEAEIGVNFGSEEKSLVTGQESVSESYDFAIKLGPVNLGIDRSREVEGWPRAARYSMFGRVEVDPGLSLHEMFENKPFNVSPVVGLRHTSVEFGHDFVISIGGGIGFGGEFQLDVSEGFRRLNGFIEKHF